MHLFHSAIKYIGIGIPMGRNDNSHLANIFLHMYEKTYFEHLHENYQPEIIAKFGYPYMKMI